VSGSLFSACGVPSPVCFGRKAGALFQLWCSVFGVRAVFCLQLLLELAEPGTKAHRGTSLQKTKNN
jgi:hypothetical protein